MADLISRKALVTKLSQGYWDMELQQAKNDPCVIDAMIDWAIRIVNEMPLESPWHTGTPTEEGCFYALQCKGHRHPEPYFGVVVDGVFSAINWEGDLMPLPPDLIAWQKIEHYKEKEDDKSRSNSMA